MFDLFTENQSFLAIIYLALVNNIVLAHLSGIGSIINVSRRLDAATVFACVNAVAIVVVTVLTTLLLRWSLHPLGWVILTPLFAMLIAAIAVLMLDNARQKFRLTAIHIEHFALLSIGNSALLATALSMLNQPFHQIIAVAIASALAFMTVTIFFAAIRMRLNDNALPSPMRGLASELLALAMMSIAITGLSG